MKISVVLAAYNGEKYIEEQLQSLLDQTREPDEVLIYDDRSSDLTDRIVVSFIEKHGLSDQWTLKINDAGKGCYRNFIDGALDCSGELIFYCDQDDIWDSRKIERMEAGFDSRPDMLACCCLEQYVDETGEPIQSLFDFTHNVRVRGTGFHKVSFADSIKYNKCPGLCLCFRKTVIEEIKEMLYACELPHDLPVGNYAALRDGFYVLNQKLVKYRQHASNTSAPRITVRARIKDINEQIIGRKRRLAQMEAICDYFGDEMTGSVGTSLYEAIEITQKSILHLQNRDTAALFRQLFVRNPMINRWISANNFACALYDSCRRSGSEN